MTKESVCLVMPAYNECEGIVSVCQEWLAAVAVWADPSLIVVDDGSRDATGALLDALAAQDSRITVLHQANAGHGPALRRGYEEAITRDVGWVFHTDSDAQFFPDDFARIWNARPGASFVLGVRVGRQDPRMRLWISWSCRLLIAGLGLGLPADPNSPFRLIRREALAEWLKKVPRDAFAPNIFLSLIAARQKNAFLEVPVRHRIRQTGKPSLLNWRLVRACAHSAKDLARFRLHGG